MSEVEQGLGLDSLKLIFIAIVAIIVLVIRYLYKLNVFGKDQFSLKKLSPSHVLYYNFKGNYRYIGNQFEKIGKQMSQIFTISRSFGVYYDDPKVIGQKDGRGVIGILVNEGEVHKIEGFLKKFDHYTHQLLPSIKYIGCFHPYINFFSFIIAGSKVYPNLRAYVAQQQKETYSGIFQIYHFLSEESWSIEILAPLEHFELLDALYEEKEQPNRDQGWQKQN